MEEWVNLLNTNGYKVSSEGRVKGPNGSICKQFDDGGGLLLVKVKKRKLYHLEYVDRLVARAFVDNLGNYAMVEHINGDLHNNKAKNLRWVLKWTEKRELRMKRKPPKEKPRIVQLLDGKVIGDYKTMYEASMKTGISRSSIYKNVHGMTKQAGGYQFKQAI